MVAMAIGLSSGDDDDDDDDVLFQKDGRHEPSGNGGFLPEQSLLHRQAGKGWFVARHLVQLDRLKTERSFRSSKHKITTSPEDNGIEAFI